MGMIGGIFDFPEAVHQGDFVLRLTAMLAIVSAPSASGRVHTSISLSALAQVACSDTGRWRWLRGW